MGGGTMPMAAILTSVLLGLAGVVMLVLGWRGRRVDERPLCRGCGFDLSGTAGAGRGQGEVRCPECGRDVREAGRVRVGTRVRRKGLIATGLLMLLLSAALGGFAVYTKNKGVNWYAKLPGWALVMMADGPLGRAGPEVMSELAKRAEADRLSDRQLRELSARALRVQKDVSRAWLTEWGDVVQAARRKKLVSDEETSAFARGAVSADVRCRTVLAPGMSKSLSLALVKRRSPSVFAAYMQCEEVVVEIGSEEKGWVQVNGGAGRAGSLHSSVRINKASYGSSLSATFFTVPELAPGMYSLRVRGKQRSIMPSEPPPESGGMFAENKAAQFEGKAWQELSALTNVKIVGVGESTAKIAHDPTSLEQARETMVVRVFMKGPGDESEAPARLELDYGPIDARVSLAATAFEVKDGKRTGRSWAMGQQCLYAASRYRALEFGKLADGEVLDAETVDVEFLTDVRAAENTADVFEVAGVRAVFKNVPVRVSERQARTSVMSASRVTRGPAGTTGASQSMTIEGVKASVVESMGVEGAGEKKRE